MVDFTFITSNKHKLEEFRRLIPKSITFDHQSIELDEIQSLDLDEIVKHKVLQAYSTIKKPVVVEDVSAGLDKLNGLPGPFIKFFNERLGRDSLHQLGGDNAKATVICSVGYYDGKRLLICRGEINGKVIAQTSDKGFGFDGVFVPDGYDKTFADLGEQVKNKISHRAIAIAKFVQALTS